MSLETKRLKSGRRKLLADYTVSIGSFRLTVPAGTTTDYSSIPQPMAWLVRWSRVDLAGLVHDYLYQTGLCPRSMADLVWRIVAQEGEHSANLVQAWIGWFGLRLGGWLQWRRYRRGTN